MAHLSQDLKQRIVDSVLEENVSQAATARRLMVSESTVSRTIIDYRERGTVAPRAYRRGPKPSLEDEHFEWIRARMEESPFLSTYELAPLFREAFPALQVHRSTILRALHRIGLSVKKRPASRPSDSRKR